MEPTQLVGPAWLAKRCDVHPKTVIRWRATGTGPKFTRAGRLIRYEVADVERWLEERSSTAAAA